MARHIGILGGTFDPVHLGHLILATYAREQLGADEMLVVPNAQSPLKTNAPGASFDARIAMLKLAFDGMDGYVVSNIEGQRGGISYMVDTLDVLSTQYDDARFHLILGADALRDLPSWHEADRLRQLTEIAVVAREGEEPPVAESGVQIITMPRIDISATAIRDRIARGLPVDYLTVPSVVSFIQRQGLYKNS